jgi:hypothetical protein
VRLIADGPLGESIVRNFTAVSHGDARIDAVVREVKALVGRPPPRDREDAQPARPAQPPAPDDEEDAAVLAVLEEDEPLDLGPGGRR